MASPIRIISSMATRPLLNDLIGQYAQKSGLQATLEAVGGVDAAKRVQAREAFDAVVLASNVIDTLIAEGKVVAGSRVDLVRSGIAVAVPAGAPRIDIGSEQAVREAVLAARTVGYSTGPSGTYITQLFERWGVADQIKSRIVRPPPGVPVGSLIAKGEVELGFQQLSELMNVAGIEVLGPLPPEIQSMTVFSAGIAATSAQQAAVRDMLAFMASAETAEVKRDNGMEPA
ncbi:molybdate ABC transporter substrate-binding protein [Pigmentiphaga soli]|uniref:Molybdate ABC transporter substrate-binding protein n=1 Tax=Pigmentiphaga soli TaxID=1007095 RepID=A0ABP8H229_9BURK